MDLILFYFILFFKKLCISDLDAATTYLPTYLGRSWAASKDRSTASSD